MLSKEEFEAWLDNPATQQVLQAIKQRGEELKASWCQRAWESGHREADIQVWAAEQKGVANNMLEIANLQYWHYLEFINELSKMESE